MASFKAGLHKRISSIFDGVPLQKDSADSVSQKTAVADFVPGQPDGSGAAPYPTQQQSYSPPSRPVQKFYTDTVEEPRKPVSKVKAPQETAFSRIYKTLKAKLLPKTSAIELQRQKASLILVPVLCLVLVFIFVKFVLPPSPKKVHVPVIQTGADEAVKSVKINWQIPQPISASLRDPMRTGNFVPVQGHGQTDDTIQPSAAGGIFLAGIVFSEDKAAAIIGSQIMYAGEKIEDVTIVKVEKNMVTFEWKGQTKTLKVGQNWNPSDQTQ
jgi:hypothetical protein